MPPQIKVAVASSKLEHVKRGVETWTRDTAYALKAKGVDVTLYKGSGENRLPFEKSLWSIKEHSDFSDMLVKILPKWMWHVGFGFAEQIEETTFAWSLIWETWKKGFDIIHTQDAHVAEALNFARKLKLIRTKVILGHGTEEPFRFLKKFDYIQHLAPYHLQEATQHCGEHPGWFAIGNFVDTERFQPGKNSQLRQELNIPQDALVALSVAAIKSTHKRVDYLIREVAALIKAGHKNVYLVVAGSTSKEIEPILALGRELLGEKVKFLINQGHEKMPAIHKLGDVFVLGSLKEMMPIALLEGLASGLPCLVNRYPVLEWMIGPGGEAIDMSREGELAAAIKRYMDPTLRQEKGRLARRHAEEQFSKDVINDRIIAMYDVVFQHDKKKL